MKTLDKKAGPPPARPIEEAYTRVIAKPPKAAVAISWHGLQGVETASSRFTLLAVTNIGFFNTPLSAGWATGPRRS